MSEVAMVIQSDTDIDFKDFDGNEDGEVDLVILIVKGWGDGGHDQFWPHMSYIHSSMIEDVDFDNLLLGLKLVTDYLDKSILVPNNINHPYPRINFISVLK